MSQYFYSLTLLRRWCTAIVLCAFIGTSMPLAQAETLLLGMPLPGTMVSTSAPFTPILLKGLKVHPENPLQFDFIVSPGESNTANREFQDEVLQLVKYFMTSLTVPEKDMWVNLSPYEKDRIIPETFGLTEMGRDLLAQDYVLKQITASLLYPEGETGKEFWVEIYKKTAESLGTTDIPVDTFNKVWIIPQKAEVYEKNGAVYITASRLKVLLDADYMAMKTELPQASKDRNAELATQTLRDIVIPVIEKEVNEGRNFAKLRQVYHSLILAAWYKRKIKKSLLSEVYVDRNEVQGVTADDPSISEKIWAQYVEAFKKGVYNFIKEERDRLSNEIIPRRYFSGGFHLDMAQAFGVSHDSSAINNDGILVTVNLSPFESSLEKSLDPFFLPQYQRLTEDGMLGLARGSRDAAIIWMLGSPNPKLQLIGSNFSLGILLASHEINQDVITELIRHIKNPDKRVSVTASKAILWLAQNNPQYLSKSIDSLVALTVEEDPELKNTGYKLISLLGDSAPSMLSPYIKFLLDGMTSDYEARKICEEVLENILISTPSSVLEHISYLMSSLNSPNRMARLAARTALLIISDKVDSNILADKIRTILDIINSGYEDVRPACLKILLNVARNNPSVLSDYWDFFINILKKQESKDIWNPTIGILVAIVQKSPMLVHEERLKTLISLLKFSTSDSFGEIFGNVAAGNPALISAHLAHFFDLLRNVNRNNRIGAARILLSIANKMPNLLDSYTNRMAKLLWDAEPEIGTHCAKAFGVTLAKLDAVAGYEEYLLSMLKNRSFITVSAAVEAILMISAINKDAIRSEIIYELREIANSGGWDEQQVVIKALNDLEKLSENPEDSNKQPLDADIQNLLALVQSSPGSLLKSGNNIFESLIRILDKNDQAISSVSEVVRLMTEYSQDTVKKQIHALLDLIKASDKKQPGVIGLLKVLSAEKSTAKLLVEYIDDLIELLSSADPEIREVVALLFGSISVVAPDVIVEKIDFLLSLLSSKEVINRSSGVNVLTAISENNPVLLENKLDLLFSFAKSASESQRKAILQVLGNLALKDPLVVAHYTEDLMAFLNESNDASVKAAEVLSLFLKDEVQYRDSVSSLLNTSIGIAVDSNYFGVASYVLFYSALFRDKTKLERFFPLLRNLNSVEKGNLFSYFSEYISSGKVEDFDSIINSHPANPLKTLHDHLKESLNINKIMSNNFIDNLSLLGDLLEIARNHPLYRDEVLYRIIITANLFRQGFNNSSKQMKHADNIEDRLPQLRMKIEDILAQDISSVVKRELLKALPFGGVGQIFELRNQAIHFAIAAYGYDRRDGMAGRIRDRIHNMPSPEDLLACQAYIDWLDGKENAEFNLKLYGVFEEEIIPDARKKELRDAALKLLDSLKDVYGNGSARMLSAYLYGRTINSEDGRRVNVPGWVQEVKSISPEEVKALAKGVLSIAEKAVTSSTVDDLKQIQEYRYLLTQWMPKMGVHERYTTMYLDIRLETLSYNIFNRLPKEERLSMSVLEIMWNLAGLSGYGVLWDSISNDLRLLSHEPVDDLRVYALLRRMESAIAGQIKSTSKVYHPEYIQAILNNLRARAKDVNQGASVDQVEIFVANMFRGELIFLVSEQVKEIKEMVMSRSGLNEKEVLSSGVAAGILKRVSSVEDMAKIGSETIIVMDRVPADLVFNRDTVAGIIILQSDSLLSHPAIRARTAGIPMVFAPGALIEPLLGKNVILSASGEDVVLEEGFLDLNRSLKMATVNRVTMSVDFLEPDLTKDHVLLPMEYTKESVGNKAYQLFIIESLPLFDLERRVGHISLPFGMFQRILNSEENAKVSSRFNFLKEELNREKSLEKKRDLLRSIQSEMMSIRIPLSDIDNIQRNIIENVGSGHVFIRSSTNAEDLQNYAGAGLYDSFGAIDPRKKELLEVAIKKVWASLYNEQAYMDRRQYEIDESRVMMAVLIQEMLPSRYSIVIHTVDPISGNADQVLIEAVQGMGESLVSGSVDYEGKPHRFLYHCKTGQVEVLNYSDKNYRLAFIDGKLRREPVLSSDLFFNENAKSLLKGIAIHAKDIERLMGGAQDIEVAITGEDASPKISYLQARAQAGISHNDMAAVSYMDEPNDKISPLEEIRGGVDFNIHNVDLKFRDNAESFEFDVDPELAAKLRGTQGFVPVITSQRSLDSVRMFMRIDSGV